MDTRNRPVQRSISCDVESGASTRKLINRSPTKSPRRSLSVIDENSQRDPTAVRVVDGSEGLNRSRTLGGLLSSWGSLVWRKTGGGGGLALYEDEPSAPLVASYFRGFTLPGPVEVEQSETKTGKANLGVVLGVYLPTIQHIFGVIMFLRLFWIVGIMGVTQSFAMISLCCFCTFLTCISMSAIATNGVVESGGSYFMISRNLGPEFGTAVGVLFYLANAVAAAMYLVGSVEIILLYIFPSITIGGAEVHQDTGLLGMMTNNIRIYASALLLIVFLIVAMGVRFVQLFAPVSLFCVVLSVLSIYAGGIQKAIDPMAGKSVCMLNDHLLRMDAYMPVGVDSSDVCLYCRHNSPLLIASFCPNDTCDAEFQSGDLRCVSAFPGFLSQAVKSNMVTSYMQKGEANPGVPADKSREVYQDLTTSFFLLLAIYFPSVTGIMTGSNMSGDLKDPQKSIPIGTIGAQLTTSFVYLSLVLVFGSSITGPVLRDKYGQSLGGGMVVAELAWPSPWILLIGSFTSAFGAALQCLCSAPRLLQSIAKDNVIPALRPFSVVTGRNEPMRGLLLTTLIVECAILVGGIDHIAPIVDFFFLMCYAFVNLICALHSLLGAPNWRPRFRFYHWFFSLVGAFICFFIMFSTHWYYAILSLCLCLAIYKYVEWKGAKKEWGDGIRGLALTTAQYSLMKIEDKDPHPKNWRPQLLLLMKPYDSVDVDEQHSMNMFHLASQLKAGKGLAVSVSFLEGDATCVGDRQRAEEVKQRIKDDMAEADLLGFAITMLYNQNHLAGSFSTLIQSVGIGGLRPNTIMVGWPYWQKHDGNEPEYWNFLDKIHRGAAMDMCLIVPKGLIDFPLPHHRLNGSIDVWWILLDGGLLLLISFLLKQHKVWRGCQLRLFAVAQALDNSVKMKEDLQKFVYQLRIDASVTVVELSGSEVSAYAYQRTMQMEERSKYISELHLSPKERQAMPQLLTEVHRKSKADLRKTQSMDTTPVGAPRRTIEGKRLVPNLDAQRMTSSRVAASHIRLTVEDHDSKGDSDTDTETLRGFDFGHSDVSGDEAAKASEPAFTPAQVKKLKAERLRRLDREKVKKMHTAVRLNQKILEYSKDSQLVVLNLPRPPRTRIGLQNYMEYLEMLTEKLPRVLLVRGTGKEVITMYS
uniref:Solute carrier family 12 member 6 n=1 Tax=Plectus sambesii TaxID=2011161 RepID=A0A914UYK5_9BILA